MEGLTQLYYLNFAIRICVANRGTIAALSHMTIEELDEVQIGKVVPPRRLLTVLIDLLDLDEITVH